MSESQNTLTGAPSNIDNYHTEDVKAGIENLANFEHFNQKNDVFRRSWLDDRIRSEKSELFYTDLSLAHDSPARFGVKQFCNTCQCCSQSCPVRAIPGGLPTAQVHNQSNIIGVRKWTVNGEKCFGYWTAQNSACAICIRICPYNKDYTKWQQRLGCWIAVTRLQRFMLWLDSALGYGEHMKPKPWWQRE